MSSVQPLREFICERLTAAAAEIFSEFEKTILRYEEEIDRQRRLLDVSSSLEQKLLRGDLQQELVHKTRVLKDQQLCKQERTSSMVQEEPEPPPFGYQEEPEPPPFGYQEEPEPPPFGYQEEPEPPLFEDQEEPEPPQIKVEEQELCTNQEEDQLHLKQETDPVMVTVLFKETESEPDREQLISQSSAGPEDLDQDSGSNHTEGCHGDQAGPSATSETFFCEICGETFFEKSLHFRHVKVHKVWNQNSDQLLFCCPTCGKKFSAYSHLVIHMRRHTGEKLFLCKFCGKNFTTSWNCKNHMMTHTGEKPFSCQTCGKRFKQTSSLTLHMRIHTGEKPFSCQFCRKQFISSGDCKRHVLTHTGEKPFFCQTCGRSFNRNSHLKTHMKVHRTVVEKSFTK